MLFRLFATEKVTDDGRRQTFVSDQAVLDRVAKINELLSKYHRRHYIAPIPIARSRVTAGSDSDRIDY